MLSTYDKVYRGYAGDGESHRLRIFASLLVSLFVSICVGNLRASIFPLLATTLSVLAGFSFSVLSSDRFDSAHGLPDPENETDRRDIILINSLVLNYQIRVKYFITIAVIDLLILVASSFVFELSSLIFDLNNFICHFYCFYINIHSVIYILTELITLVFSICAVFLFLENVYTFYRLSETILSIIDRRRGYLENR